MYSKICCRMYTYQLFTQCHIRGSNIFWSFVPAAMLLCAFCCHCNCILLMANGLCVPCTGLPCTYLAHHEPESVIVIDTYENNYDYKCSDVCLQNEAILLIHFSARYSRDRIKDLLDAKLPPELREKCTPMLEGFR